MRIRDVFSRGQIVAAVRRGDQYYPVPGYTTAALIALTVETGQSLDKVVRRRVSGTALSVFCLDTFPLHPTNMLGAGVTYPVSAEGRAESARNDAYMHANSPNHLAELFEKGHTPDLWAGDGMPIGVPTGFGKYGTYCEPELCIASDPASAIVGVMPGNDVSIWDIEKECMLYLPISKVFRGGMAFGPELITMEEIGSERDLQISMEVFREGNSLFGAVSFATDQMVRPFSDLVKQAGTARALPGATLITTGTGGMHPWGHPLKPGDEVRITMLLSDGRPLMTLTNVAEEVPHQMAI